MTRLNELSAGEIVCRLADKGLPLRVGPITFAIRSPIAGLAEPLANLYTDYPLAEAGDFVDFRVELNPVRGRASLARQQVEFTLDGRRPFLPMPRAHAFPLLEWGLNWCVATTMNCWLIFHAAVLARDGKGLILPGCPGSGKSTLTAVLANRGWRLLSDEHAILDPESGALIAAPRPISLKNESIALLQGIQPGVVMSAAVVDTHKGTIAHLRPPADSIVNVAKAAIPAWLIFPSFERDREPVLVPVVKGEAAIRLAENSFNYSLHGATGFTLLAGLVSACETFDLPFGSVTAAADLIDRLAA